MNAYLKLFTLSSLVISIAAISGCAPKTMTTERNKNITLANPFGGSTEGQCYKIMAENKDYYGRLDKDGHPLVIPEIADKDISVSLSLLSDNDCKEQGL
ncbi:MULTISPECIES: hypothetical protein [Providencia]|uniref:hypothetical protein n=1 Tax=Providencia TaxID=586 RepID=UPI001419D7A9|nr:MULTISPECIES: hypothetical protein [Providencia]EJD6508955.1 hypothetical protein [Providencia rettgeri]EJD6615775.1 hypothetical protein [Providencia rettgeri]ELR5058163.1 hypothetical protein [Providencia rettgeri]ELR5087603.1 hypothetical protein [Providencia rettgeri]ELR5148155.1 hypothetical protein [Providencia rettgeri]